MSMLHPSPQTRLIMAAAAGLGAAAMAGYAWLRTSQAHDIEAGATERLKAAEAAFALDQQLCEAEIAFTQRKMLAESEAVLGVGVPLLRLCGVRADDIANHPLPEPLRFLKALPPFPTIEPSNPYRSPALNSQHEAALFASPSLSPATKLSFIAVARAQHGVDRAEAAFSTATAFRAAVAEHQARLEGVVNTMRESVTRAADYLKQVGEYAVIVHSTYVPPCWLIARRHPTGRALSASERHTLLNLGAALRDLATFTQKEMQL